jgi:CHAT domain
MFNGATNSEREAQRVSPTRRKRRDLIASDSVSSGLVDIRRPGAAAKVCPTIVFRLFRGRIEDAGALPGLVDASNGKPLRVDSVAVGHYHGVRPQAAELALDRAISRAISGTDGELAPSDLILTQFTDRGLLRGDLGTTFFLPILGEAQCLLAVAGMGPVGGCGAPELTVLVRELGWALGRYGKKHLATLLIGSGNGNLSVRQCVEAWARGLKRALDESDRDQRGLNLRCVTFVEFDPLKIGAIQAAILDVRRLESEEIDIKFEPLTDDQLHQLEGEGLEMQAEALARQIRWRREEYERRRERRFDDCATDVEPTRFTVGMTPDPDNPTRVIYRFGALTATASIPERAIVLHRVVVEQANDELALETDPAAQHERGEFLGRILIPQDLRSELSSTAPMVLQVDATTARIHWEMVSQPDPILPEEDRSRAGDMSAFLGTYRGLTRQLRTTFARTPQPGRNHQAAPRVLVVADPAREHPLQGAAEEGLAVAALFETFNTIAEKAGLPQRFQVTRLVGPLEASPTRMLRELTVRRYELLHYAGHCFFDPKHPAQSGWIFSGGVVISASELERIDRVPSLVVSNACESGITPDRAAERSAALVPSFAEAFFAQGVANYVGTAWPVDDMAARLFATTLYGSLIGLDVGSDGRLENSEPEGTKPLRPRPMHLAMLRARLAVANTVGGRGTWGAYQHYGNPYYRIVSTRESG